MVQKEKYASSKMGRLHKFQIKEVDQWVREGKVASGKKLRGSSR